MLELIILGLATWRLSSLVAREYGPFGLFFRIRCLFKVIHDEDDIPESWPEHLWIVCIWCLSIWLSLVLYVLPQPISYVLAASALAVLVESYRND